MKKFLLLILPIILASCIEYQARLPFEGNGVGGAQNSKEEKLTQSVTKDPIIFIHGWGGSSARWSYARQWFLENGYGVNEIFMINLDRKDDYEHNNQQIKNFIGSVLKYTGRQKAVLIGHSRGGLLIRNYLYEYGPEGIAKCVTLASPLSGSYQVVPETGMHPHSPLIKKLNANFDLKGIPFLCLKAESDPAFTVADGDSPYLKGAANEMIPYTNHISITESTITFKRIVEFLKP